MSQVKAQVCQFWLSGVGKVNHNYVTLQSAFENEEDEWVGMSEEINAVSEDGRSVLSSTALERSPNHPSKEKGNSALSALANRETKAVNRLRILLILALVIFASVVSALTFVFLRNQEENEFKKTFTALSSKVVNGVQDDSFQKFQALQSLSSTLTRSAMDTNSQWPFVSFNDSARLFAPYMSMANAASLTLNPLVQPRQRVAWEKYVRANQNWVERDLAGRQAFEAETQMYRSESDTDQANRYRRAKSTNTRPEHYDRKLQEFFVDEVEVEKQVTPYIKNYVGIDTSPGPWLVSWQYAPVIPNRYFLNFNRFAFDGLRQEVESVLQDHKATISRTWAYIPGIDFQSTREFVFNSELLQASGATYNAGEPVGYVHYPVFEDTTTKDKNVVAVLTATVFWKTYFLSLLSQDSQGIICVVNNNIGQSFTYRVDGDEAMLLGNEDLHDSKFDDMAVSAKFSSFTKKADDSDRYTGVNIDDETISYNITIFPSSEMEKEYVTSWPIYAALALATVFIVTASIFVIYDFVVNRRQNIVMRNAKQSGAILSSLFPDAVKDKLMEEQEAIIQSDKKRLKSFLSDVAETRIPGMVPGTEEDDQDFHAFKTSPIADFFPETTILFADMVGFTAWSSAREPAQVFTLLETVYSAFDKIAKRRRVFKVETIGDCYVAVTGLPDPRNDHAVVMCRFAKDCLFKMEALTKKLESSLGPDTGDLTMRIGLHSGPVTAGVLRGEKARFQLFGDTMNTASRMESTGSAGRIQLSQETANLVIAAGKQSWFSERDEKITAKGKGELQTFWLKVSQSPGSSGGMSGQTHSTGNDTAGSNDPIYNISNTVSDRIQRLVEWNYEVLRKILKCVVARREAQYAMGVPKMTSNLQTPSSLPMDEVLEIIELPNFDAATVWRQRDPQSVKLSTEVESQLWKFISTIANMYHHNAFHNFEHASHVALSITKLMSRIVAPSELTFDGTKQSFASSLHDHTYGITSDPLTQFACVFSGLIHDVDHSGVPNAQLIEENLDIAAVYKNKSVAEQNSIDLAWDLFSSDQFVDLQEAVCCTEMEQKRFRELVVNSVLATDIMDQDLKKLRNERWNRAFSADQQQEESSGQVNNRKATIVIEHLIQASDVAHTMQHWNIYCKWNKRLFLEMYSAFKDGRAEKNPKDFWYQGELGFFDFYIIPLAKKLKECGVFGVSSDEYLNYAEKNRAEWETKGQSVVAELVEEISGDASPKESLSQ